MEELFSNPGSRIKRWAIAVFILECIGLVVAFFAMLINQEPFWQAILILLGGLAAAYILCLFLVAFGQLVQTSEDNAQTNRQILQYLRKDEPQAPPVVKFTPEPAAPQTPPKPVLTVKKLPKDPNFEKALRVALTFQSDDKMREQLGKLLNNRDFSAYWSQLQDILDEIPRSSQRRATEELRKAVE